VNENDLSVALTNLEKKLSGFVMEKPKPEMEIIKTGQGYNLI
jgi:hypothetical protein